jgi:hypothetical protein
VFFTPAFGTRPTFGQSFLIGEAKAPACCCRGMGPSRGRRKIQQSLNSENQGAQRSHFFRNTVENSSNKRSKIQTTIQSRGLLSIAIAAFPSEIAIGVVFGSCWATVITLPRRADHIERRQKQKQNVPANPSFGGGQSLSGLHGRKVDLINWKGK